MRVVKIVENLQAKLFKNSTHRARTTQKSTFLCFRPHQNRSSKNHKSSNDRRVKEFLLTVKRCNKTIKLMVYWTEILKLLWNLLIGLHRHRPVLLVRTGNKTTAKHHKSSFYRNNPLKFKIWYHLQVLRNNSNLWPRNSQILLVISNCLL